MKAFVKNLFLTVFFSLCIGITATAQTLDDYLLIAAENNPRVKSAYAEFEAALQEVPQVKSLPDPSLTVSAFGNMVETRLGPQEARFSLMQMFPWFGTLEAKADVAALMAKAKFQAFLEARNELYLQVSEQFFDLYVLQQTLEFQRANLEILQNYKDLALSRVGAGTGALSDVLQADLIRNETETKVEVLVLKKQPIIAGFNALLNRDKFAEVILPEDLLVDSEIPGIDQPDISGNPRLEELENMAASARAQKDVAEKAGMPSFGLGVDYVIIGDRTDMVVEDSGRDAIMPMLSVSLPIFRKKYRAARKQAEYLEESYVARKLAVENQLGVEFEAAVFEIRESRAMLALYEKQVESSKQVLNLLLSGYRNAAADFEEILRVRQELLKYQIAVAEAQADLATAIAKTDYLSGKILNYER